MTALMQPRFIQMFGGGHSLDQIFDDVVCLEVLLEQLRLAACVMSALNFCNHYFFYALKN